jgi:hypothetical protein
VLDSTLPTVLKASIKHVNGNFTEIFNELGRIRDWIGIPPNSDGGFAVAPPGDSGATGEGRSGRSTFQRKAGGGSIIGTAIDLTDIGPYPAARVHWTDPPELPGIRKFYRVEEAVDFIYRMFPKLQAHLLVLQKKLVELNAEQAEKIDRSLVERMFERFQGVIAEIKTRFDDLKDAVEQTATRDEINVMMEDLFHSLNLENETSIGRVKCIACGRETTRVTGAMAEGDVARTLGNPPNSIAFRTPAAPQPIGVVFSSKDGFDSAITESPRSVRPYRQMGLRPKVKAPNVPPTG